MGQASVGPKGHNIRAHRFSFMRTLVPSAAPFVIKEYGGDKIDLLPY